MIKCWEGFWSWFLSGMFIILLCQVVNGLCLTLDLFRIFMLEFHLGSVICDLYAYLHDCVVVVLLCVCIIFRWDSYVFPYDGWYR